MNMDFNLKSLNIRGMLFLGFSLLIIPMILGIVLLLFKVHDIEEFTHKMSKVIVPTQAITAKLDTKIYETQVATYKWLLTQDPSFKSDLSMSWEGIIRSQQVLDNLTQHHGQVFKKDWDALKELYPKLQSIQNRLLSLESPNTNPVTRDIILHEVKPVVVKMWALIQGNKDPRFGQLEGLFPMQMDDLIKGSEKILYDVDILRTMTYVFLAFIIALAFLVSLVTARKIVNPIRSFSKLSSKIAAGDLTQRIRIDYTDEMGILGRDLNTMTEALAKITGNITESSQSMISILAEVKHASDMQFTGISEQASSINEITASLEEIDKSATQTMEKAKALGRSSEETSKKGRMGLEAVQQSIAGMKTIHDKVQTIAKTILELSNQTQQIGEITAVVNTLALQSKMLALNAAIEAAKAGDAGRGFAVVAAEVKNLAEQSEQSTIQVQKILEDIRHGTEKAVIVTEEGAKGVAEGTGVVEQMGSIMQSLTEAINETMLASQQIEVAVRQESLGIEQITVGMNEINQVTSSFVKAVNQTTLLINDLGDIAQRIKDNVDVYKV